MQKNELNTLLELKQNPSLTQRSLARKLNISLGLTNSILKNLISRGLIKAKKDTGRKLLRSAYCLLNKTLPTRRKNGKYLRHWSTG